MNLVSRISAGTYFKGEIISPNDLRIDGKFDGHIVSEGKVVIGESAEVNASIVCVNADVWGKTKGSFTVKDIMSIKSDCSVEGELKVRRLIVELGASFNGTCKMITEQEYDKVAAEMLKDSTSHRYNRLPLLPSGPGGFSRSWSCMTYPTANVVIFSGIQKLFQGDAGDVRYCRRQKA